VKEAIAKSPDGYYIVEMTGINNKGKPERSALKRIADGEGVSL
jgi:hypothetical protein